MILLGQILLVVGVVGFVVANVALVRTMLEHKADPAKAGKHLIAIVLIEAPFLLAALVGYMILYVF